MTPSPDLSAALAESLGHEVEAICAKRHVGLYDYSRYPGDAPPHVVRLEPGRTELFRSESGVEARAFYEAERARRIGQAVLVAVLSTPQGSALEGTEPTAPAWREVGAAAPPKDGTSFEALWRLEDGDDSLLVRWDAGLRRFFDAEGFVADAFDAWRPAPTAPAAPDGVRAAAGVLLADMQAAGSEGRWSPVFEAMVRGPTRSRGYGTDAALDLLTIAFELLAGPKP